MNYLFIDLRHAIERNSLSLLNGEWMVCWFQFNEWPDAIAKMDHRLQIQGVRINPDVRTQPSEKRSVPRSVGLVVEFQEMEEVLLTERRPHTPREGFLGPSDRYFKTSTHKEGVVIDHARIRSQNAPARALVLGYLEVMERVVPPERRNALVDLQAAATSKSKHHDLTGWPTTVHEL